MAESDFSQAGSFFKKIMPGSFQAMDPIILMRGLLLRTGLLLAMLSAASAHAVGAERETWLLEASTIVFTAVRSASPTQGISHEAKGKGYCDSKGCQFLIGVLFKSFATEDLDFNRSMLEAVQAKRFPILTVNAVFPEMPKTNDFRADLELMVAGKFKTYKEVSFAVERQSSDAFQVTGATAIKLDDFGIDASSFPLLSVKNEIPVRIEATWKRSVGTVKPVKK